jgi:hypothetical protein
VPIVLISSGESLCIRLPTNSDVLKTVLGTEVAADSKLIIVVVYSNKRGVPHPTGLFPSFNSPFALQALCREWRARRICVHLLYLQHLLKFCSDCGGRAVRPGLDTN